MKSLTLLLSILVLIACGCSATQQPTSEEAVSIEDQGPAMPLDHPAVELPATSREIKRLTVAQLQRSLPVVAGNGITWTVLRGDADVEALSQQALGLTLGSPDYIYVTEEPAQPTALYAKFMDDMARDVCGKMGDSLVRFQDPEANLRYLMLRFLGEKVTETDTQTTAPLRAVFDAASISNSANGWQAVCVSLFLSPAFHLY